ncbi:MAG: thiol protease/hemagglutinin PrtT [Tannerellaceae bacterium]|jgi:hypothetical protein|nr:thiol protease/hemagglutinin PrtT [Tannerellaceae bacterium]
MNQSKVVSIGRALSFVLLLFLAQSAFAAPVNERTAEKVAVQFASSFSSLRSESKLTLVHTGGQHPQSSLRGDDASSLYYIYNIEDEGGFVIVAGDDRAYPVLGYTDQGSFQAEGMPENLAGWLDFYARELLFVIEREEETESEVGTEIHDQWAGLLSREKQDVMNSFLLPTANWNQDAPYNRLCPVDGSGKRTVTGCVATAMGIVMKYHNWPDKGQGSHSYNTRTDELPVSASFDVVYDWNNMLDTYTTSGRNPNWNSTQSAAVATLLFHCGVAVEMDYSSTASGAYTHDAITALVDHFDYDKGMSLLKRDLYEAAEWAVRIRAEIDNDRPVLYAGSTKDESGHLFVIDGYAATGGYFHVNWGWSGIGNGNYRLSGLQPEDQGIGGSLTDGAFSYYQEVLVGIQPAMESSFTNNELFFIDPASLGKESETFGLYTDVKQIVKNEPFKLFFTEICDYGMRDFTGELGLFLTDRNSTVKDALYVDKGDLPSGYLFLNEKGASFLIESDIEDGDVLRMYYRPEGYEWRPLRGDPGAVTELPVYNESATGIAKVVKEESIRTVITDGRLYIHFPQGTEVRQVSVYTLLGKEVATLSHNTAVSPIVMDMNGAGNKILIITIHTSEGILSQKVVVHE